MDMNYTLGLTLILTLGASAQWLAWRFKLPSILLLLIFGFLAGPVTQWINPDLMLGKLAEPFISLAVAVVLFEGGLSLDIRELKGSAPVILRLVTVGSLVGWVAASFLANRIVGLSYGTSLLTGAILIITGPTVIGPMLRAIRPKGRVRDILKWEGILNDPIGAVLAVLIMEAIVVSYAGVEHDSIALQMIKTLITGLVVGGFFSFVQILLMRKKTLPDFLHNSFTLAFVLLASVFSNALEADAGLIAVTLMGVVLANQREFSVRHIIEFKENLQVLLIASLFIILSARLELSAFRYIGWHDVLFVLSLIVIVRPLTIIASTLGSKLPWRERFFLMLVAPRGIVVMAMASVFAFRMSFMDGIDGQQWLAMMLVVVIGTVSFYGIFAGPAAQWLKLANRNPQGILFIGAHPWACAIASKLKSLDIPIMLIDSNPTNIFVARRMNLPAYSGNIFSEEFLDLIDLSEMGKVLVVTSNDEVNTFAFDSLSDIFDRAHYYRIAVNPDSGSAPAEHVIENLLFGDRYSYNALNKRYLSGAKIVVCDYPDGAELADIEAISAEGAIPLFCIYEGMRVKPFTSAEKHKGADGARLMYWELPSGAS